MLRTLPFQPNTKLMARAHQGTSGSVGGKLSRRVFLALGLYGVYFETRAAQSTTTTNSVAIAYHLLANILH